MQTPHPARQDQSSASLVFEFADRQGRALWGATLNPMVVANLSTAPACLSGDNRDAHCGTQITTVVTAARPQRRTSKMPSFASEMLAEMLGPAQKRGLAHSDCCANLPEATIRLHSHSDQVTIRDACADVLVTTATLSLGRET